MKGSSVLLYFIDKSLRFKKHLYFGLLKKNVYLQNWTF